MSQTDLRNLLTKLHASLVTARSLDEEDRRLLTTALADIENALAEGTAAQATHDAGLESLAVRFEADHPALAEGLRRVVDTLGKAGV